MNFAEKVTAALETIESAYKAHGDGLVLAHSLGKDSSVIWHLAGRVSRNIRGFIVTTRFKPAETVAFMGEEIERAMEEGRELHVYDSSAHIEERLYRTDPDKCCSLLKVEPVRRALQEMRATCWITGLRATEGRTRTGLAMWEERDEGLVKLNPILDWEEREVWMYLALHDVPVNPLYKQGYRSLGCAPCTHLVSEGGERDGRWIGTSKCGGECGIHTQPLMGGSE